jgi:multiple sugar transport system substrate-binding protein
VAVIALLAGCTSTASKAAGAHELSTGPISLAMPVSDPAISQAIQQWNRAHPGELVTVTDLPKDSDQRRDTVLQNLQNHSPGYDVVATDLTATAELAAQHYLDPLTGPLAVPTTGLVAPAVAAGSYRGSLYAAPLTAETGLLFYRADLLPSPPATWPALTAACATAQRNGLACFSGQYAQGADLAANLTELIAGAGGSVLSSDGAHAQLDSAPARAALQFLADSYRTQVIPQAAVTYQQQQSVRAFSSGALLMLRARPDAWRTLAAQTSPVLGKVKVALLPGRTAASPAVFSGTGLAVNGSGKHLKTAAAFMNFLLSTAVQRSLLLDDSAAPSLKSVYADASMRSRFPFLDVLSHSWPAARSAPVTPVYSDLSNALSDGAYSALTGAKTPEQASKDLQAAASSLPLG